jgi:bifunctional DNase/RNase
MSVKASTCCFENCDQTAESHFVRVQGREIVEDKLVCNEHGHTLTNKYWPPEDKIEIIPSPLVSSQRIPFDIGVLYGSNLFSSDQSGCEIRLVNTGGSLRVSIQSGPFEFAALYRALCQIRGPRPATHHAIADIISALHGCLDCTTIDSFDSHSRVYGATLHIRQQNQIVSIDMRPSDAIILSVICSAPIFVSRDVLVSLGYQKN